MKDLVEAIISGNLRQAKNLLEYRLAEIAEIKLNETKKMIAAEMFAEHYELVEAQHDTLDEAQRFKIVRARVRGGKIQRRKKVATVKGYTIRGGKLTRMSATERRRRKMSQRKGAIKRRAKKSIIRTKTRRSMMKRKAFGG